MCWYLVFFGFFGLSLRHLGEFAICFSAPNFFSLQSRRSPREYDNRPPRSETGPIDDEDEEDPTERRRREEDEEDPTEQRRRDGTKNDQDLQINRKEDRGGGGDEGPSNFLLEIAA